MQRNDKIFLAGHKGMVGSAILRQLLNAGYEKICTVLKHELDLRNTSEVESFFQQEQPDYVLLAAAKVGGIKTNNEFPADFLYDNLMIQNNIFHASYRFNIKKLLFLGSSCIYPRDCPQPMKEDYLMTGPLEPTNEGYAIAKIAGLKMAQYYYQQYGLKSICPMPCNLYGPNDSFDLNKSHVLSALVRRFIDAVDEEKKEVILWGTGNARREFMHVDDLAKASLFLMEKWDSPEIINVGWGIDISIKELAELIAEKVGYRGRIFWDVRKPDGMLQKCLDITKLKGIGFEPAIKLTVGIDQMIDNYKKIKTKGEYK